MRVLLLNQTFHPDVASTAQHLTDLALGLREQGHAVSVITSRRAYDNPDKRFAKRENWRGICISRVSSTGFGKSAKWRRAADFASFVGACCLRLMTLSRPDAVVALTSPPLISFIGACYARLRGARFYYWVMDLNPDEAIAAGWLREDSLLTRVLQWMSRYSFRHATKIISLDKFMRARIEAKGIAPEKIAVIPPWAHDDTVRFDAEGRETFRRAHGLSDKFVVMYSGNHSPCHPLDTLLDAARRLAHRNDITFCFVGGGSEFRKIQQMATPRSPATAAGTARYAVSTPGSQISNPSPPRPGRGQGEVSNPSPIFDLSSPGLDPPASLPPDPCHLLPNIFCLPYQPLSQLSASLSAADLHVVVMGEAFVGTIHPCKIYNVLSVGAPILYIGPGPSHLSEILDTLNSAACGSARHGDVDRCVKEIERMAAHKPRGEPERYAEVAQRFSQGALLPQLVAELERGNSRNH